MANEASNTIPRTRPQAALNSAGRKPGLRRFIVGDVLISLISLSGELRDDGKSTPFAPALNGQSGSQWETNKGNEVSRLHEDGEAVGRDNLAHKAAGETASDKLTHSKSATDRLGYQLPAIRGRMSHYTSPVPPFTLPKLSRPAKLNPAVTNNHER